MCCSTLMVSNGRPRLRIFELNVGRNSSVSQYAAPAYAPGRSSAVPEVGNGVDAAIQTPHFMLSRFVSFVALTAAGSNDALHEGGGGPAHSSASSANQSPASCRTSLPTPRI